MFLTLCLLLCAMLLCALISPAEAEETFEPEVLEDGDFEYILMEDSTADIREYRGEDKDLTIPPELNSVKVTAVGSRAFSSCGRLTFVSIPDSVTVIGDNPFYDCEHLISVHVTPDHPALEVISGVLFSKADKRLIWYPMTKTDQEYDIPQETAEIGAKAFSSCISLTSVIIPDSVTAIGNGGVLFL